MSSKTSEAQRITDDEPVRRAPEGFPDHNGRCILVHDSNCSTRRGGDGLAASDSMQAIDVFAERRERDRIGATQTLLNLVGSSR